MALLTLDKVPKQLSFWTDKIDFDLFLDKFLDYIRDKEDLEKVKNEIKNTNESFDYKLIRWNYV